MIRPFRAETERYGHYSVAGEFVYDHPFQWGSQAHRPGPGARRRTYSDDWHRIHLNNPRDVVPESNMPAYPWLRAQRRRRAPTSQRQDARAAHGRRALHRRGDRQGAATSVKGKTELDALIAYLQGLGTARCSQAVRKEPWTSTLIRSIWHGGCSLAVFLGIVWWAYAPARREALRRGGRLPFDDDERPADDERRHANERVQQQLLGRLHRRRSRWCRSSPAGVLLKIAERAQGRRRRRRDHRPRLGRGPAATATTRCRAGGCGCSTSPSSSRLVYLALYPGPGQLPGLLGWSQVGQYEAGAARRPKRCTAPIFDKFAAQDVEALAEGPAGAMAIGAAAVPQQLRRSATAPTARGSTGFPEPDRRRLALRRHARDDRGRPSPTAATA